MEKAAKQGKPANQRYIPVLPVRRKRRRGAAVSSQVKNLTSSGNSG